MHQHKATSGVDVFSLIVNAPLNALLAKVGLTFKCVQPLNAYFLCSSSQKESSEKPEIYHGDSRGRSASTSDILTAKSLTVTPGDSTQPFATSKSMSGLSPFKGEEQSSKDAADGNVFSSGLSPFFAGPGESTTDAEIVGVESLSAAGKAGAIQIVGDPVQLEDSRTVDVGGAAGDTSTDGAVVCPVTFDLDSLTNSQSLDSSEVRAPISQVNVIVGELDSVFADQSTQGVDRDGGDVEADPPHVSEPVECPDEADIAALLAGGRRDSVNAFGTGGEGGSTFYPAAPEESESSYAAPKAASGAPVESSAGLQTSDALVQKCADKLVAEILQSVSLSAMQRRSPDFPQSSLSAPYTSDLPEGMGGASPGGEEEEEDCKGKGADGMTETRNVGGGADGEELRIGNIVYLPVEESSDGEMVVRNSGDVVDSLNAAEVAEPFRLGSGAKIKTRPPPLSGLGTDEADGSSPSLGDGARARTASGSFSPLRSSAQHLSNFVNYATGFFRTTTEDRVNVKDIHDIPVVRERGATLEAEGGRRKGGSVPWETRRRFASQSECRAKNAVKAEERPELFRQVSGKCRYVNLCPFF